MNHAGDGLLQAYIDGEVTGEAEAALVAHIGTCATCGQELDELRSAAEMFHGAMALMIGTPALEAARTGILRASRTHDTAIPSIAPKRGGIGRFAAGSLARAAALVLLVAGGAAAIIPGSPLRRWITQGIDRAGAALSSAPPEATPLPPVEPATVERELVPGAGMFIAPVNDQVRVFVYAAGGEGRLTVRLVDASMASVQTDSSARNVTFRRSAGRMDILNLGTSHAEIRLPRTLGAASVEVNGTPYLIKDGDQVRVTGPTVRRTSDEIVFRTGS
jgi:hypothetical protein